VARWAVDRRDTAAEPLRTALELAHEGGASALEARVVAALRATGARPRRAARSGPKALTPSERRVSDLAAQGLSNREIAEALFVTVRTVEYHLRAAYRKLEIDSRRRLASALG
jgi:DNA-binding NarL/FixJ family response regulator